MHEISLFSLFKIRLTLHLLFYREYTALVNQMQQFDLICYTKKVSGH